MTGPNAYLLQGLSVALFLLLSSCQSAGPSQASSGRSASRGPVRQETRIGINTPGRPDVPYPWQVYYHQIQADVAITLDNPYLALDEINKELAFRADSVYLHLQKAKLQVKVGQVPEAEKTARRLAEAHPDRLKPWLLLGSILELEALKETDPTKQKQTLEKIVPIYLDHVLALDPLKDEAYIALSDLYAKLGKIDESYAILNEGVAKSPTSAYLPFYLGTRLARIGQFDRALSLYRISITRNPRFEPSLEGMGDIDSKLANWDKARKYYEMVLSLEDVGKIEVEVKLLKTYFALKQYSQAVSLLKRAITEHPQNNRLPLILSSILVQQNRYDEAILQIEAILKTHPENPRLLSFLGSVYEKSLHFTRAIATYRLMIRRFPNLYEGSYNLGDLYRRLDNSPKALLYLEESESLSPERWEIPFSISLSYMDEKKFPQAVRALQKAMVLSPQNPILVFNLAILYDQWNHTRYLPMVKELLTKTLAIDPGFADALNYRGYTDVVENGDLVRARFDILHALTEDPTNGAYRDSLGWLYERQGHFIKALREETRALGTMPHDPTVLDHAGRIERRLAESMAKTPPTAGQAALLSSLLLTRGGPLSTEAQRRLLISRAGAHLRASIMIHPLKRRRVLRYLTWFGRSDRTFIADLRKAVILWTRLNPSSGHPALYRVDSGDTLQSISAKGSIYGTPRYWKVLRRANRKKIANPNDLPWGLILRVPHLARSSHARKNRHHRTFRAPAHRRETGSGQNPTT